MKYQEKAKIEKLATQEVNNAIHKLRQKQGSLNYTFCSEYLPKDTRKIVKEINSIAEKAMPKVKTLEKKGYQIQGIHPQGIKLYVQYGEKAPKAYKNELKKIEGKIKEAEYLKKEIIMKLYGENTQMTNFLKEITKSIQKILE